MASAIHCAHYDNSFVIQDNALVVPDGSGQKGLIEFQFFCPERSRISLLALVKAPKPEDDAFLVQIDEGDPQIWQLCENDCNMEKFEFKTLDYGFTSKIMLDPGKHDVRLWSWEDGALLQYLQIGAVDNEHSKCYFMKGNYTFNIFLLKNNEMSRTG